MLTDSRIDNYRQTSFACPEQYAGTLDTGEFFYFRYRNGYASLTLGAGGMSYGPSDKHHTCETGTRVGDGLQGIFDDDMQRNSTFTKLLDELDALVQ